MLIKKYMNKKKKCHKFKLNKNGYLKNFRTVSY